MYLAKLKEIRDRIDNLSVRERAGIMLGVLFVLHFAWGTAFMRPLEMREAGVRAQLLQKQGERLGLQAQIQKLVAESGGDPRVARRNELQALKTQLAEIEKQLVDSTQHLVAPRNMAAILETVLRSTSGLTLLGVKGLGASPVLAETKATGAPGKAQPAAPDNEKQAAAPKAAGKDSGLDNAYKHGLQIDFIGDYFTTLEYVRALEALEWGFFWDSLEFEVREYPEAKVSIKVFTLSLDKNWIGV